VKAHGLELWGDASVSPGSTMGHGLETQVWAMLLS